MKIQLLSDLHLEVHTDFSPEPLPGADALVLAGDIGSYQPGSQLRDTDFGLARFSPLPAGAGWPTPVYYVPGNHEYDALDVDAGHARLRASCDRLGIVWLDRQVLAFPGAAADGGAVRFVGTTLWADFDALGPAAQGKAFSLAEQLKARHKAFRAADHYLRRTGTTRGGQEWLAAGVREEALNCQRWLRAALATPFEGKTVVVTHFAPSLHSADPRYGLTPGTAGFCNALDDLLSLAQVWLHGHLHAPSDYVHRGCRVVANPLGYAGKGEQLGYRSRLLVEV
ncbi:metallophosphoesterase [Pseudorhodoferax sp. Leaf267]|uniref:metallophosphoesterase n=1 Tax=Pseudorhodoferax sp. Leaf267 TaxID=1736316 RepID=UPI0006F75852|nr:metallophosphoesterase [Pseudorhodoferax sp. Leaf267]KQP11943.1 metallophosphoesterase [Pseudorhodoferax sp. Leaf267]